MSIISDVRDVTDAAAPRSRFPYIRLQSTESIRKRITYHVCGKTFAFGNSLNIHVYIHIGDQSFKCKISDKSCT